MSNIVRRNLRNKPPLTVPLDPDRHHIILQHVFGTNPAELRRQRQAEHLHRLGARPVLEALIEVANGRDLDCVLADFGRLDGAIVRALAADRFAPAPIHEVQ